MRNAQRSSSGIHDCAQMGARLLRRRAMGERTPTVAASGRNPAHLARPENHLLTKFILTIDEPLRRKCIEARTALGAAPNPARQERDIWEVLSKFILTSDETNSIEEDRSALGSARRPASFLIFKYERHEATVTCARCCSSRLTCCVHSHE